MLRVGLTGGIACGKSSVAEMLVKRGAYFLSADSLAHQLYEPGTPTYREIISHFGKDILGDDGVIVRSKLASLAFPDRIQELNAIVHPAVIEAQRRWMADVEGEHPDGIAVLEAALLIEGGVARDFDKIIVVTCGMEQKVARFAQRAGVSFEAAKAEVQRRSSAQISDEEKARWADYIVDNSGSSADTERQVDDIWRELQAAARR